jgi:nucleotide-binding universal stress UspA family protein
MKILLAVDGSKRSLAAADQVIRLARSCSDPLLVELVTVHLPVPKLPGMSLVVGRKQLHRYYKDESEARLRATARRLEAAGLRFTPRSLVGPVAERIVGHAAATGCDFICIASRGMSDLGKAFLGSTATKVLQLSDIPVVLVK